jgi:arsenite-transporting ATPase
VLGWYMQRVFETQRRVTKLTRPALARLTSLPIASDAVFGAIRRFYDRLDGVRDLLADGAVTSARLVVNPERMVVAEARRTYTYLALFGYHVDAVIANRMLPGAIDDPWFARWKASQSAHLEVITDAFAPLPVLAGELAGHELVGCEHLSAFAASLYAGRDAVVRMADVEPLRVDAVGDALVLSVHLPFTDKRDVQLGRTDGELFLTVGPHRRAFVLPDSLLRREVGGAHLEGDRLQVEFV